MGEGPPRGGGGGILPPKFAKGDPKGVIKKLFGTFFRP